MHKTYSFNLDPTKKSYNVSILHHEWVHFVDTNSFNHLTLFKDKSSTVSNDDVVVHNAYCVDLDLSLIL